MKQNLQRTSGVTPVRHDLSGVRVMLGVLCTLGVIVALKTVVPHYFATQSAVTNSDIAEFKSTLEQIVSAGSSATGNVLGASTKPSQDAAASEPAKVPVYYPSNGLGQTIPLRGAMSPRN